MQVLIDPEHVDQLRLEYGRGRISNVYETLLPLE